MTSGVYRLTFASGNTYIGKSINIETRWKQHNDKLLKGKAAANMQAEYNMYGLPSGEVLLECHADHVDIVEACYINRHRPPLNGTYPPDPFEGLSDDELQITWSLFHMSTLEHVNSIRNFCVLDTHNNEQIDALKNTVTRLERKRSKKEEETDMGYRISKYKEWMEEQDEHIAELEEEKAVLANKLEAERNRSWFSRLFS